MLLETVQEKFTFFFSAIVSGRISSPRNAFVLEFDFHSSGGWEIAIISNPESLESQVSCNLIYFPWNIVGRKNEEKEKKKINTHTNKWTQWT